MLRGSTRVVIGTRAAAFAPVADLGLVALWDDGDDSYAEPYWYVSPSPYPATHDLPPLTGGGHWHTTGWVGAALPASDYVEAADQRAQVAAFVESSVAACRRLLGG